LRLTGKESIYGLGLEEDGRRFLTGDGEILTDAPHDAVWKGAYIGAAERTIRAAFRQAARKGWRGVALGTRKRGVRSFTLEAGRHRINYVNPSGWGENIEHPALIQERLRDCQSWCNLIGWAWRPTAAAWLMGLYRREGTKNASLGLPDFQVREFEGVCRQIPPAYRPMVIRSYMGGPIVVASGELEPCVSWDRIRAYSNSMKRQLPVGAPVAAKWLRWDRLRDGMAVLDATVRVRRDLHLPPLPVRMAGNAIVYPTGTFRGTWTNLDLDGLERRGDGEVLKVHDACVFNTAPVLGSLLEQLDNWEQAGFRWAKFCANAFGGKWAQHHNEKCYVGYSEEEIRSLKGNADATLHQDEGMTWVVAKDNLFDKRLPIYRPDRSSFIVARNRVEVFDAVRRLRPGSVAALHVDAIWTDDRRGDPGPSWRKEGDFTRSRHYGPGVYVEYGEGGKVGHSGMEGDPSASDVERLMRSISSTYRHAGTLSSRNWSADPALHAAARSTPLDAQAIDLPRHVDTTVPVVDLWSENWSFGGYPTPYGDFWCDSWARIPRAS
tara:strand:+ start:12769 stop:14418 length:1650 start_codon:yes stop_codon:yes gene_type:complete